MLWVVLKTYGWIKSDVQLGMAEKSNSACEMQKNDASYDLKISHFNEIVIFQKIECIKRLPVFHHQSGACAKEYVFPVGIQRNYQVVDIAHIVIFKRFVVQKLQREFHRTARVDDVVESPDIAL